MSFMTKSLEKGFELFLPFQDFSAEDCILRKQDTFKRIQIKSTTYKSGKGYWIRLRKGVNREAYTKNDCDFFAILAAEQNVWYIIPLEAVDTKSIMVYPTETNFGYYEQFKERWDLLQE